MFNKSATVKEEKETDVYVMYKNCGSYHKEDVIQAYGL